MKAFYKAVKEQLEDKGMTIYRLSKETGIFEKTLYSMLNGNTSNLSYTMLLRKLKYYI